jgi:two-component system response regulator PilR (NtrC family)
VRELENILERALALADEDRIDADDLRLPIVTSPVEPAPAQAPTPPPPAPSAPRDPRTVSPYESAPTALPSYIEEVERQAIEQALQDNRYNKTRAAAALGITFRALRYKLKKLGID